MHIKRRLEQVERRAYAMPTRAARVFWVEDFPSLNLVPFRCTGGRLGVLPVDAGRSDAFDLRGLTDEQIAELVTPGAFALALGKIALAALTLLLEDFGYDT